MNREEIEQALAALGEQLAALKKPHVDMLVCGGAALHALGLVTRTTKDVDVVALVSKSPTDGLIMSSANPLPPHLIEAAKKVERDFRLKDGWINPGPTSALDFGLPEGVLGRAELRNYGSALTVRFISRYDQVHFKLYAAVDQGGKHYQDLLDLRPTGDELEKAARWSMTHDVSETYRSDVKRILKEMGHGDVAQRL
jgi:hypothetical protein